MFMCDEAGRGAVGRIRTGHFRCFCVPACSRGRTATTWKSPCGIIRRHSKEYFAKPRLLPPGYAAAQGLASNPPYGSVILRAAGAACFALLTITHADAGGSLTAPHLGTAISESDAQKWNLNVFPDGTGLPAGRGTAKEGRAIYDKQCQSCHGPEGRGATAEELVGEPRPPTKEDPSKAIGSYWPYATTLFDFTRRSMPPATAGLLTNDDVYAVTAYLLFANKIIAEGDELNALTLPKIKMPNRDGFVRVDVK